jgi:hypothetical protein
MRYCSTESSNTALWDLVVRHILLRDAAKCGQLLQRLGASASRIDESAMQHFLRTEWNGGIFGSHKPALWYPVSRRKLCWPSQSCLVKLRWVGVTELRSATKQCCLACIIGERRSKTCCKPQHGQSAKYSLQTCLIHDIQPMCII